MSTESIMSKSLTLSKHKELYPVTISLTNDNDAALNKGHAAKIKGNLTVDKCTTGAHFPIGIVEETSADGELTTVHTIFSRSLKAKAIATDIPAGSFVKPNGNIDAEGKPEVVLAVAPVLSNGTTTSVLGDWCYGIVISGALQNAEIEVGIFRTPIILRGTIST